MVDANELLAQCEAYLALAVGVGFDKEAAKKKKHKEKKLDPKAHVRNRGDVVFPAESSLDHKDHFEINTENQARNAWARAHQYSKAPKWYKGSLKSLQDAVKRKVHSKYKNIEFADKKKKSSLFDAIEVIEKYS